MGLAAFQNHSPGNLNYEVISGRQGNLQHYWYDRTGDHLWHPGGIVAPREGSCAAFQNRAPGNYNYEVLVTARNGLDHSQHYWYGHLADGVWHTGQSFGDNSDVGGAFQNRYPGNYDYEVIDSFAGQYLRHYRYNHLGDGKWHEEQVFASGVRGLPAAFQNTAGNNYNLEVVFPETGRLRHYWYDYSGSRSWNEAQTFGSIPAGYIFQHVAVFQNYSPGNYNYEVMASVVPGAVIDANAVESQIAGGGYLRHYWYNHLGDGRWHEGQRFGEAAPGCSVAAFQENAPGDYCYHVFVTEGSGVRHYRYGHLTDGQWHRDEVF